MPNIRLAIPLIILLVLTTVAGSAQDLEPPAPGEDKAAVVSTEDVRVAIEELLDVEELDTSAAITTSELDVPLGALDILLEPLTLGELEIEIASWKDVLKSSIKDLSAAELQLFEINAAEAEAPANEADEAQVAEKADLIEQIGNLREVRTALADRLRHVLDAYEGKGGDPTDTVETRTYISAVGGVRVDTQDFQTTILTLKEWAISKDGGMRLLRYLGTVLGAILAGLIIGWIVGVVLNLGLRRSELTSKLLRRFIRKWMTYLGAIVGLLFGLSSIGVNMTPILASLGAAGFILAFALQNTISNFASGLLILFQSPFDAGDEIEAAGVIGEVERVSLFATHLSTAENRKVIIPNNMIWEDVVVNSTGAPTRRLSIEVEINAEEHGLEDAEQLLMQVMADNPGVLQDPEPALTLSAMTAESYTFTCWPWVATQEKDKIRWELVSRFGRELSVLKGVTKSDAV